MLQPRIANPIAVVVGHVLGAYYYNHRRLNNLFVEKGAPGEPPEGNCEDKCIEWLKRASSDFGTQLDHGWTLMGRGTNRDSSMVMPTHSVLPVDGVAAGFGSASAGQWYASRSCTQPSSGLMHLPFAPVRVASFTAT
jgi:hypothetical protein